MVKLGTKYSLQITCVPLLVVVLFSCNITYAVRNQRNVFSETLYFPCGKVAFELRGKGNSKFVFYQQIHSDENFIINPDSLHVYFNDEPQVLFHKFKNVRGRGKEILQGVNMLETSFEIEGGVFEGDTIFIYAPGYVFCHTDIVDMNMLVYPFINNIRIYGVNAE
jgi:hypothetical protein